MTQLVMPSPRRLPLLGHVHWLRPGRFSQRLGAMAARFDGIFRIERGGMAGIFVTTAALTAELSDETRFRKVLSKDLIEGRAILGDGLITARTEEPAWAAAHGVLLPAFSEPVMRGYFESMAEVTGQLVAKWAGTPGADIAVAADMSRLTLDILALVGFGQRFDSFAAPDLHPFLAALREAVDRVSQPGPIRLLRGRAFKAKLAIINDLVDAAIRARRAAPVQGCDLLSLMMNSTDRLDDLNIRCQVLTFLAAGYAATGALVSFALYALMAYPGVLAQAYAEVDRVLPGDTQPEYDHLAKLDVIGRVLQEALRLWPPASVYTVAAYADTTLGGYPVRKDEPITVLLPQMHRDGAVWADPETFDIDRFLPEAEATLPPHCYKPFGSGLRACIGRPFALTEAKLALAMILQHFALSDPGGYLLSIEETLAMQPAGFTLRARPRRVHERMAAARAPVVGRVIPAARIEGRGRPLTVLYGTRLGTCQDIATHVAEHGRAQGFTVVLATLDERLGALPEAGILAVVSATYNGLPPDSAARTGEAIAEGSFATPRPGLDYALLGCGNTLWATYQAFPKAMDAALAATGARALLPRAEADANADFDGDVERWLQAFWRALADA